MYVTCYMTKYLRCYGLVSLNAQPPVQWVADDPQPLPIFNLTYRSLC